MSRAKIVVVTGATSGIGRAITRAFAQHGARVFLIGRNSRKLASAARSIPARRLAGTALANLASVTDLQSLVDLLTSRLSRIDVLVHAAGEYEWTQPGFTDVAGFDLLFDVNVRAPYLLSQGLRSLIGRAAGQVIFVNSSVVHNPGSRVAIYKATQHALQGLTDSLRQDLNKHRIRVTSLFPGRTATPRMRRIYARSGERYRPHLLLNAADVARLVVTVAQLPDRMEITDVRLRSVERY